jgi:pimeloyl-ACP methyl ester carboxylesterase
MIRQVYTCIVCAVLLGATTGCTDLMLRSQRDDTFLDQYRYVLGEQYLTVDGMRLCYQERGQGDTVIILPGLATTIDFWQLNVPELEKKHHVIVIDLPGLGKSDKPDVACDLPWMCDRLVSFLNAKGIQRASFIGGSLGGHLAMLIALRHPERVDSLVLMGSSGAWPTPGVLMAGALRAFWNDAIVVDHMRRNWAEIFHKMFLHVTPVTRRLFHYQVSLRANRDRYWPEGRSSSRALRSIFFHSCLGRLRDVHQPVLLVWGEHDRIHLRSEAMALRDGLPDARLVIVADASHEVMVDQPEEFNRLVLLFLEQGTHAITGR